MIGGYPVEVMWAFLTAQETLFVSASVALWIGALIIGGMYNRSQYISLFSSPQTIVASTFVTVGLFSLLHLLLPRFFISYLPPAAHLIAPLLLGEREIVYWLRRLRRQNLERTLLVAPRSEAIPLRNHLLRHKTTLGIEVVGTMSWEDYAPRPLRDLSTAFAEIKNAMDDCQAMTLTVTSTSLSDVSDTQNLRWLLEQSGYHLNILTEPSCLRDDALIVHTAPGLMLIEANAHHDTLFERFIKRTFDILISAVLILILIPLWITLVVAIRLDDNGPAFFLQRRVGRNGRPFKMFKFRTMVTNAEKQLQELRQKIIETQTTGTAPDSDDPDTGVLFKLEEDPRVTRIGRFLRRTSLDELPQLFNVFLGHMSLVGPRPPLPREVMRYSPKTMRKFVVRPGITGLWQVSGRSDLSWRESVRLDLHYIEHRSLRFDLWILVQTLKVVLRGDGAY